MASAAWHGSFRRQGPAVAPSDGARIGSCDSRPPRPSPWGAGGSSPAMYPPHLVDPLEMLRQKRRSRGQDRAELVQPPVWQAVDRWSHTPLPAHAEVPAPKEGPLQAGAGDRALGSATGLVSKVLGRTGIAVGKGLIDKRGPQSKHDDVTTAGSATARANSVGGCGT